MVLIMIKSDGINIVILLLKSFSDEIEINAGGGGEPPLSRVQIWRAHASKHAVYDH